MQDPLARLPELFPDSYFQARERFLAHAPDAAGYASTATGPQGEPLWTDVAWFGPRDAARVAVLVSATHGIEGYCGSAAQLDWISGGGPQALGPGQAVLVIHAINPYGYAHDRRVTQEGCDLNRNFVDFEAVPDNPLYDELAPHLVPAALSGPVVEQAEAHIQAFRARHGELAFQAARKSGQYRHPTGMFFGGTGPTASRLTLEKIVRDYGVAERERVLVLDYHTGLGPYGYGELQCEQASGLQGYERARALFGPSVTSPDLGTSSSVILHGTQDEFWQRILGERHTYVCLEFGTYDPEASRRALRADHWLALDPAHRADPRVVEAIRRQMRDHYYPDRDDWKEMVLWRCRQVHRQLILGLRA